MKYVYKLMDYIGIEEDLRGVFGISNAELPDELIHRLSNLPAAERSVQLKVSSDLTAYDVAEDVFTLKLAILYECAANCLPAVRINILQKESDTKTTAQRFADALKLTEEQLRSKSDTFLSSISDVIDTTDTVNQLEFWSPDTDQIDGAANA